MYYNLPSQTEKGLRNVSQTMIIFLVVQLLGIGVLVALLPLLVIQAIDPSDPAIIATALTLLAALCALLLVIVIALTLGLIRLTALNKGKAEFGPQHSQKVDRGILVLVLGILVPAIIGGIGGAAAGGAGAVGLSPRITPLAAASSLAGGILGSVLCGLFLFWSIETLATPQLRQRGLIALVLGVVSAVASGVASLAVVFTVTIPTTPTTAQLIPYLVPGLIGAAITFVSLLLWYVTYRGILDRFKRGELRAAPPPMVVPPMYGVPYGQQPYAPYGPPPYQPPPQQPPPGSPPPNP